MRSGGQLSRLTQFVDKSNGHECAAEPPRLNVGMITVFNNDGF